MGITGTSTGMAITDPAGIALMARSTRGKFVSGTRLIAGKNVTATTFTAGNTAAIIRDAMVARGVVTGCRDMAISPAIAIAITDEAETH
jgi:hypothetical protein